MGTKQKEEVVQDVPTNTTDVSNVLSDTLKSTIASDNGNSSTKMIISLLVNGEYEDTLYIQKSVVAPLLTLPNATELDEKIAVANLMDNIIVGINSQAVEMGGLYAVGQKALNLSKTPRNMNIYTGDKSENEIPLIMSLSMIACSGVQKYYEQHQKLPKKLEIQSKYSSALPAREYTPTLARKLESLYTDNTHVVDVYVGEAQVTVNITFTHAKVTQEGNPALFAIIEAKPSILDEFNKRYGTSYSNEDLFKKKVLIIDIGDGTTEWIYIVNGAPQADLSDGERLGVGHAADNALKLFKQLTKINIAMNRQQFMSAVIDDTHKFHSEAKEAMERANLEQVLQIIDYTQERFLNELQGDVDIFIVIGGGSAAFGEQLSDKLYALADKLRTKVLWSPKEKASTMNVEGSNILNKKLFFKE